MYKLSLQRPFTARHYLIGGDWGPENELHSHDFILELRLTGNQLDPHGYLIDLVELENQLEGIIGRYQDQTLNDLPEFEGLNPSIEHFSRIVCKLISQQNPQSPLSSIEVRVWENQDAWASFTQEF
jgi:6-pyruvoyltetrahydropterin/6-carboxytetrahydropterin synthase